MVSNLATGTQSYGRESNLHYHTSLRKANHLFNTDLELKYVYSSRGRMKIMFACTFSKINIVSCYMPSPDDTTLTV